MSAVGRSYSAVDSSGNGIFRRGGRLARVRAAVGGKMLVFRALGWLLLALAVAAIVHDALAWWSEGSFRLLGLGDLWAHLDTGSYADAQTAVQRHLSTGLWIWIVRPLLALPALPAFVVLGLLFLWLGRRGGEPREARTFVGGRQRRRRRSRGGLS